jgi:AraC-like DNA-binding protein
MRIMIFFIQNMTNLSKKNERTKDDYFRYFPDTKDLERWGIWVSASGIATVAPGNPYPPLPHPGDHHFEWERGRVLESLQIVMVTAGEGLLETRQTGVKRIAAGSVILLRPGVWHRYKPDPETGWRESWIEMRGRVVTDLLQSGTIPDGPLLRGSRLTSLLEELLETIHRRTGAKIPTHRPELSAEALRMLALLCGMEAEEPAGETLRAAVTRAEHHLAEHHAESLDMQDMARMLGVSYSSFRRAFRKETGLSPWQYLMSVRLNRARRLLSSRGTKLESVAAAVGFSSAFHLSAAFKKAYGVSPGNWRKQDR